MTDENYDLDRIAASKRNKANRHNGKLHEAQVRALLEAEGYVVDRWTNQVDIEKRKIVKPGFNRFNPYTGFPDFIAFKRIGNSSQYFIKFVECKLQGTKALKKEEKEKIMILYDLTGITTEIL